MTKSQLSPFSSTLPSARSSTLPTELPLPPNIPVLSLTTKPLSDVTFINNAAPPEPALESSAVLIDALDQAVQVKDKVEECAAGLSTVNAVLSKEVAASTARHEVKLAIAENEVIEGRVQECVDELAAVNRSLIEEIGVRKYLHTALDVSNAALAESQALEAASAHKALHDETTGLPNLTLFNDRLGIALRQAERHQRSFAVMFIDLNKFKRINDTHGHDVGDSVLCVIAQRLQALVRGGDTVARRSGDEFLFLMLDIKDATSVINLAIKINTNLALAYTISDETLFLSASIGIAIYPAHGTSATDMLKNADTAMYVAKQSPNGYALYELT